MKVNGRTGLGCASASVTTATSRTATTPSRLNTADLPWLLSEAVGTARRSCQSAPDKSNWSLAAAARPHPHVRTRTEPERRREADEGEENSGSRPRETLAVG